MQHCIIPPQQESTVIPVCHNVYGKIHIMKLQKCWKQACTCSFLRNCISVGSRLVMWPSYTSLRSARCELEVDACGCGLWVYPWKLLCHGSCDQQKLDCFCYICIHWHVNRWCGEFGVDVLRRCGDIGVWMLDKMAARVLKLCGGVVLWWLEETLNM